MIRRLTLILFGLMLAWATPAAAQPRQGLHIEAELVAMNRWATPGSTAIVAVRQSIEDGWHTYWRNPGDSGGATELDWRLPPGVTAGEIVWPTPERQRLGALMNYGYSGEVYLPVPIQIPPDSPVGRDLPLSVDALFLVCSDTMCIPVELTLTLALPVREGAAPLNAAHGRAIETVVRDAPRPADITARYERQGDRLVLGAVGPALAGVDPGPTWFFPFEPGEIDHPADQPGAFGPQGLRLQLTPGRTPPQGPLSGVLATAHGAWEITAEPGPLPGGTEGKGRLNAGASAATFWRAVLFALIGGLILNLMPCVFPILAMKAASLAGSAHDRGAARRDGVAFTLGVLAAFLVLAGGLLALRAAGQSIGWGFQLQSPGVVAGLSLLMLAVALNLSGLFHVGAGLQSAGGPLARLPGGAGAFFTGVLAVVVAAPCTAPFMAFALGAALVMPAPMALAVFLALGLGLALPYLAVALSPGLIARLPRPGSWMSRLKAVLALPMYGAALWLAWVLWRQAGDVAALLFAAAALLLATALWLYGRSQADDDRRKRLGAAVLAMMAVIAAVVAVRQPAPVQAEPDAAAWSPQAVAAAQGQGQVVFVNITADWCVSCKVNEAAALNTPSARRAFARTGAVYLKADWTRRDPAITAELARHGRSGVPLYLVYGPGEAQPRILPQLLTPGLVVRALEEAGD